MTRCVGPGMIRRINREIATRQVGTPDDVKAAVAHIAV